MPLSPKDEEFLLQVIAGSESSGRNYDKNGKMIKNPESSARFKYQIVKKTFEGAVRNIQKDINYRKPGHTFSFDSPQDHEYVARYLVRKEYPTILKKAGFKDEELTVSHFYALHFKGDVSYVKKAFREPNTPLSKVMNSEEITKNGFKANQTLGDSIQFLNNGLLKRNNTKMLLYDPNTGKRGVFQGGGGFQFSGRNNNNNVKNTNYSNTKNTQVNTSNYQTKNTGNKFHSEETHRITSFHNALRKEFPGIEITNTKRGSVNYGSKDSRHHHGDAIDLRYTPQLERFLKSEKGAKLLQEHGLGMLLEVPNNEYNHSQPWDVSPLQAYIVNGKTLRKGTNGTAKHIHLGPDIYKNNGNLPFDPKGPNNVYNQYVQKNGITSRYSSDNTYSSGKNPGNILINNKNISNMNLTEEEKKRLGISGLPSNPSKITKEQYEKIQKAFDKYRNNGDTESQNKINNWLYENGYIGQNNSGPLNDYIRENHYKKDAVYEKFLNNSLEMLQNPFSATQDENGNIYYVFKNKKFRTEKGKVIEPTKTIVDGLPYHYYSGKELDEVFSVVENQFQKAKGGYKINLKELFTLGEKDFNNRHSRVDFNISDVDKLSKSEPPYFYINTNGNNGDVSVFQGGDGSNSEGYSSYDGSSFGLGGIGEGFMQYNPQKHEFEEIKNPIDIKNLNKPIYSKESLNKAKSEISKIENERDEDYNKRLEARAKEIEDENTNNNINTQSRVIDSLLKDAGWQYDKKKQINFDAINNLLGGSVLGLIGIKQGQDLAKTPDVLRDEKIGESYMDYLSEVKKISESGLKPEEEAYAKRMLTESYQLGLDNVVRASSGNRNLVLGAIGRLDYQRQKGLLELAVKDADVKREAFHKHGEAMKYISEFEASKEIANNERKYNISKMNKEAGAKLAAEGFKKLIDSISEYQEKRPGSIYDIARSRRAYDAYGFDPNADPDSPIGINQFHLKQANAKISGERARKYENFIKSLPQEQKNIIISDFNKKEISLANSEKAYEIEEYLSKFGYKRDFKDNNVDLNQNKEYKFELEIPKTKLNLDYLYSQNKRDSNISFNEDKNDYLLYPENQFESETEKKEFNKLF